MDFGARFLCGERDCIRGRDRGPRPDPTAAPVQPSPAATSALRLPENPQVFGSTMPSVIKATAIINGAVITQTDIDQRLALLAIANGGKIPAEEIDRLRQQVLRNLIDETLQIQAAKTEKIEIKQSDIDRTIVRVASNVKQTPDQLGAIPRRQRIVAQLAAPADRRRNRVAEAAALQDRKRRHRRRRRGQGGDRQAQCLQGHRGISRRRDLPLGDRRQPGRRPWPTPTRSSSS